MKENKKNIILKIMNIIQIPICIFILYGVYTSKIIPGEFKIYAYIGIPAISFLWVLVLSKLLKAKRFIVPLIMIIISYLSFAGVFFMFYTTWGVEGIISNITGDKTVKVSSIIVTMNNDIKTLEDIKGKKVGLLSNEEDYEGNIIPKETFEENNIDCDIEYVVSYLSLMAGLVDGDYDVIALPADYAERFEVNDSFKENYSKFKIITQIDKEVEGKAANVTEIKEGEPFTIALIGTDSALERHHHNYDVIILLTFHPETKDLVVTSVYRATGMYSSCIGGMDLVNHNGWKGWGPECLKTTVEGFFDIDINHYIMIDFEGFVELVDAIGGITADVPKDFCEQDSERQWGDNTICLKAGVQDLDGEEALAFARHRKSYSGNGGIVRSENHVKVIEAVADKIISTEIVFKFNDLLKILEDNMETDMNEEQLYNLYDLMLGVVKDMNYDMNEIHIISRTVDAYGAMLYSPAMNTVVGMGKIYADSYWRIYNTLQAVTNNNPVDPTYYSFDLGEDPKYVEEEFLDKATRDKLKINPTDPRVMPNLVGKKESAAHSYVSKYLYFTVGVNYVYSNTVEKGYIVAQSIPAGAGLNHAFRLTVDVSKGPEGPVENPITLPDMTGWTRTEVKNWANSKGLTAWNFERVEDPSGYDNNIFMYVDAGTKAAGVVYPSKAVTFYIAIDTDYPSTPVITLSGGNITLEVGDTYTDPGYSAWDDVDWTITSSVTVGGDTVDASAVGTYVVTYNVSNSQGTSATEKTRTVTVEEVTE